MSQASEHRPDETAGRSRARRSGRAVVAGTMALTLGLGTALLAGGDPASAASAPRAQAVGRFLDGAAGSQALEDLVDVKDARATNPGTVTDQNPLDVTLGKQFTLPLSGALKLPGSGNAIRLGAANQVAKALSDGYSYGASGAVANSGGVSVGGNDAAYPSSASLDLSAAALPNGSLSLPGAGSLAALGGVTATIGAVSALASTPTGVGTKGSTAYDIAGLTLTIGSPALGGVLKQVASALTLPALPSTGLPAGLTLPGACSVSSQALSTISLDGGAVTIDPTSGSITVDVAALLEQLGLNLNHLPANTDLLAYVLKYLASPSGLAAGLQSVISGITNPLAASFEACLKALPSPLSDLPVALTSAIMTGQSQITTLVNDTVDKLSSAAGGTSALAPLTDALKQAVAIGVNVQPNGAKGSYTSPLRATPDQATGVVSGQTIVRAIEIDLGGRQLSLALANAAAGPSSAAPVSPSSTGVTRTPAAAPATELPTGVPAGQGTRSGSTTLPITLLVLALVMGAAGAATIGVRHVRAARREL